MNEYKTKRTSKRKNQLNFIMLKWYFNYNRKTNLANQFLDEHEFCLWHALVSKRLIFPWVYTCLYGDAISYTPLVFFHLFSVPHVVCLRCNINFTFFWEDINYKTSQNEIKSKYFSEFFSRWFSFSWALQFCISFYQ